MELGSDKVDMDMDLDKTVGAMGTIEEKPDVSEANPTVEMLPYVGMEFESEDDAKNFYVEYARRVGFFVRVMQRRRSGVDGRTLARRLGCNKQGFSRNKKSRLGKTRSSTREGCKATILVKMEKSGKWIVTRFEKEHNHPLAMNPMSANCFIAAGDKVEIIEELNKELELQEHLCAVYKEKLASFIRSVEDQTEEWSSQIQAIVQNVRRVESEVKSEI